MLLTGACHEKGRTGISVVVCRSGKGENVIDLAAPERLVVHLCEGALSVWGTIGCYFAGRTIVVGSSNRIPVSFCPICGRNVSASPRIKLGRGPFAKKPNLEG